MLKIEGSGSESISQRHGSANPDPDPHQNVMDPQHCKLPVKSFRHCPLPQGDVRGVLGSEKHVFIWRKDVSSDMYS
jgi:hypothetical protein